MSESTTYVLLIRHGENDWVGTDRLAGRTPGVHLNEKGQQQAAELAQLLQQQPVAAIYSSPLERCVQTAQPVAEALKLPVTVEPGVLEVDYGEWQAGNLKELAKLPEWKMVQHYPSTFRFPRGETLREVQSRAVGAIERIRDVHPNQVVAIFSHGDIIRTTIAHYLGTPLDLFQRVIISTASISTVVFFNQTPTVLGVNYRPTLAKLEIKVTESDKKEA
ncbi:MAG: MSMEG_4193 family putative phosphomutase [Caldilineaceae bacterium]